VAQAGDAVRGFDFQGDEITPRTGDDDLGGNDLEHGDPLQTRTCGLGRPLICFTPFHAIAKELPSDRKARLAGLYGPRAVSIILRQNQPKSVREIAMRIRTYLIASAALALSAAVGFSATKPPAQKGPL